MAAVLRGTGGPRSSRARGARGPPGRGGARGPPGRGGPAVLQGVKALRVMGARRTELVCGR